MYTHTPAKLPKLTRITVKNRRHYLTPQYNSYPSITTILSTTADKTGLDQWREDVGVQVADYITQRAGYIGTATHQLIEDTLHNKEPDQMIPLLAQAHKNNLKPYLDKIDHIQATEAYLYSDKLKVAGTADCVAKYDGILSVIDFKTSCSQKQENWIIDYFLQATAYCVMWQEITKVEIPQIVIMISSETGESDVYVKEPKEYVGMLQQRINQYYNSTN